MAERRVCGASGAVCRLMCDDLDLLVHGVSTPPRRGSLPVAGSICDFKESNALSRGPPACPLAAQWLISGFTFRGPRTFSSSHLEVCPMKSRIPALLFGLGAGSLLLAAWTSSTTHASTAPAATPLAAHAFGVATDDPAAVITPESYYKHLYFLANDAMRGRNTPSPELDIAAAYLVAQSRALGLEPGAEDGSFYQRWPYRQIAPDAANANLAFEGPSGRTAITMGTGATARGAADGTLNGELVFVANPAAPPAAGSMAGKVLVSYISGSFSQPWLQRLNQLNTLAQNSGAAGSVVVVESGFSAADFANLNGRFAAPAWRMGWDLPLPQVVVGQAMAEGVIPGFAALAARAGAGEAISQPVAGVRLSGTLPPNIVVDGRPANVVAILRGSDPVLRDEYVVLSAHYDHVGIGNPLNGDSIYNGADDNASGTVSLLEVARAISAMPVAPKRSIAFVWVSGEEKGLLGSSWFVDNSPIPVEQMIANLNSDMIGGDAHRDTLVVIGKTYSNLGPLVDNLNDGMPELRLTTSDDIWPDQRFFFRSDQFHFMRKEIPALFFFTGTHECYHRPCDEPQRLNVDKASRIARLLTHTALEIANLAERPQWTPDGLAEVRALTAGGR